MSLVVNNRALVASLFNRTERNGLSKFGRWSREERCNYFNILPLVKEETFLKFVSILVLSVILFNGAERFEQFLEECHPKARSCDIVSKVRLAVLEEKSFKAKVHDTWTTDKGRSQYLTLSTALRAQVSKTA